MLLFVYEIWYIDCICVILTIIDKRLYLTLFDFATTLWLFTIA